MGLPHVLLRGVWTAAWRALRLLVRLCTQVRSPITLDVPRGTDQPDPSHRSASRARVLHGCACTAARVEESVGQNAPGAGGDRRWRLRIRERAPSHSLSRSRTAFSRVSSATRDIPFRLWPCFRRPSVWRQLFKGVAESPCVQRTLDVGESFRTDNSKHTCSSVH